MHVYLYVQRVSNIKANMHICSSFSLFHHSRKIIKQNEQTPSGWFCLLCIQRWYLYRIVFDIAQTSKTKRIKVHNHSDHIQEQGNASTNFFFLSHVIFHRHWSIRKIGNWKRDLSCKFLLQFLNLLTCECARTQRDADLLAFHPLEYHGFLYQSSLSSRSSINEQSHKIKQKANSCFLRENAHYAQWTKCQA